MLTPPFASRHLRGLVPVFYSVTRKVIWALDLLLLLADVASSWWTLFLSALTMVQRMSTCYSGCLALPSS